MIQAATPEDESRRLAALRGLGLLDTPSEDRFDRITRAATVLFQVPISTITLVDTDRQWFKSCVGLDVPETPRDVSFCAHAILEAEAMVIEDALLDARFVDNPLVTGPPHIRFYAGHPLHAATGERIGTFCLIDHEPRAFGAADRTRLRDLAAWAQLELLHLDEDTMVDRLHTSERRLWTILDTVAEGIVSFDPDGQIQLGNLAAERIFRTGPGGLAGLRVDELVDDMDLQEVQRVLGSAATADALGQRTLVTGIRRDGERFPLEMVIQDARVDGTRLLVAVGQDVTDRQEAEAALRRSERQFRTLFENSAVGIVLGAFEPPDEYRVIEVNQRFADMVGWSREELRGTDIRAIIHPRGDLRDDEELIAWVRSGGAEPLRRVLPTTRRDGTVFDGSLTLTVLPDREGRPARMVSAYEDVTEQRKAEQMKDEFISIVGHELRTPLTSIRGSLGLIQGGVLGELPSEAGDMLGVALSNTDRLVRLVNDMLDIERIDAGRLELQLESTTVHALLDLSLPVVQPLADEAGVTLAFTGEDVAIQADPDRIVQTLVNLLSNAIKFTPAGGTVTVFAERVGSEALVSVRDTGRGVPPGQLETIFERFQQVDASDAREKGGTGLGLAIAQRIVDGHGGRIWAESPPGEGCTIRFTLPTGVRIVRIVVCDSGDDGIEPIVDLVEAVGCTPVLAADVEEAITLIAGDPPAAVVVALGPNAAQWAAGVTLAAEAADVPLVALGSLSVGATGQDSDEVLQWELLGALRARVPELAEGHVLVVEDDPSLGALFTALLSGPGGADARLVRTADEAVAAVRQAPPAAIVLDLALPGDGDGFAVVDRLRGERLLTGIPLIVYTALDLKAADRARLQLGNTEFMAKASQTPQDIERRLAELLGREEGHPA